MNSQKSIRGSQLPQDIPAEQVVLCSCLRDPNVITRAQGIIGPADFYREEHGHIFEALCALGRDSDVVTVSAWLHEHGYTGDHYSVPALDTLSELLPTSATVRHHAEIVREQSQRRQVILSCQVAESSARDQTEELPETLSALKTAITTVEREQSPEIESALTTVQQVYREIERRRANKNKYVGIRTGFQCIDERTWGLEAGSTTYLIARPSIGKSALALNIADWVAVHEGPVLFFSLESNRHALTRRRLAARSGLHLTWIRTGDIRSEEQWGALHDACDYLSDKPLLIVDHSRYRDPQALVSMAETVSLRQPLTLVIVDHIGLCNPRGVKSMYERASVASDILQTIPKLCNCHALILCQLSREFERRVTAKKGPQYPTLADMRDSGKLEENADNVWGLWRKDKESEAARLEQLKGRDSGVWVEWLRFDGCCQRYTVGSEPGPLEPEEKPQSAWQE